jgi:hypothetical protein
MTPDMTFECLLVSSDVKILELMNRFLDRFSIHTQICMTISRALELLPRANADLVIIDCDGGESYSGFLQKIWSSERRPKPTVMAISGVDRSVPGAHVVLKMPLTNEAVAHSMGVAYGRMLQDHRNYSRHAIMTSVNVTDQQSRVMAAMVTDIGQGGIGLRLKDRLELSEVVNLELHLPDVKKLISIEARVLWCRQYTATGDAMVGCEFLRIPPVDLDILHDWLKEKCQRQIKKPQLELAGR